MSDPDIPSSATARTESLAPAVAPRASEGTVRTRLDGLINRAGRFISWLVFFAMVISVFEVIMRYVFNSPTSWVHETVIFMIACIFALGGPVALARDKHIRVRLVYDTVSPKFRRWLDIFNGVITLGFCVGMTYAAYTLFWRASHSPLGIWQLERSGTSWNPPFPALTKGIIMVALAIMTVQTVLHIIQAVRGSAPYSEGSAAIAPEEEM